MGNLRDLGEQTQERREFWKEKESQRYERGREVSQTWGECKRKPKGCREEILEGNQSKRRGGWKGLGGREREVHFPQEICTLEQHNRGLQSPRCGTQARLRPRATRPRGFLTFIVLVDIVAIVGAGRQVGQLLHRVFPQILCGYRFEGLPAHAHQHVGAVEQGLHAVDLQREQRVWFFHVGKDKGWTERSHGYVCVTERFFNVASEEGIKMIASFDVAKRIAEPVLLDNKKVKSELKGLFMT